MSEDQLDAVYAAETVEEAEAAYDVWSSQYDADLMRMGYRLPWYFVAAVLSHIPPDGPFLDAGCGTGLQIEPLHLMGWRGFTGIDLSVGMLDIARAKGLYDHLEQAELGEPLGFETGQFAATFCIGAMTPGHAPITALDELIRVTRSGGYVAFSLRSDPGQLPEYPGYVETLLKDGRMVEVHRTPSFATMPYGEPSVRNYIHICRVP